MPAENEELDLLKNSKWRPFVNTLRGQACLHDEDVLDQFDRCFVPSLRRVFKLVPVGQLVAACIGGSYGEVQRLRLEHRRQQDRAETYVEHIIKACKPGMTYRQAIDAFVHGACARILDQAAVAAVPSDNFPTVEDYRQASATWLFRMEKRIADLVDQIIADPARLKVRRQNKRTRDERIDQQLRFSVRAEDKERLNHDGSFPNQNQQH